MHILTTSLDNNKPNILLNKDLIWKVVLEKDLFLNFCNEFNISNIEQIALTCELHNNFFEKTTALSTDNICVDKSHYKYSENFQEKCIEPDFLNVEKLEEIKSFLGKYDKDFIKKYNLNITINTDYIVESVFTDDVMKRVNFLYQEYILFIQKTYEKEFINYNKTKYILKNSMNWFSFIKKEECFKNLNKYSVVLGMEKDKINGTRKEVENFIPGGSCFYNKYIYINTYKIYETLYKDYNFYNENLIFLHEVAHAFSKINLIVKNGNESKKLLENQEFISIVKKNWIRYKCKLTLLSKKSRCFLKYFLMPADSNIEDNIWKRPTEETFAESLAYILYYLLNGFDVMYWYIKKNNSNSSIVFRAHKESIMWMLKNINFELLFPNDKKLNKKIKLFKIYINSIKISNKKTYQNKELLKNIKTRKYNPKDKTNKLLLKNTRYVKTRK